MISYEISLGLSVIPILMIYGDLNLGSIVQQQHDKGWALLPITLEGFKPVFNLRDIALLVPLLISFVIFVTSLFAETNRLPFDLPECETELVAGYHTEYSSMKFALFFLGEYAAMIIGSGFAVTLFLGGWSLPFGLGEGATRAPATAPAAPLPVPNCGRYREARDEPRRVRVRANLVQEHEALDARRLRWCG